MNKKMIAMRVNRKGFTLVEMIISAGIAVFLAAIGWSMYITGVTWSGRTLPNVEVQRVARISMMAIVDGFKDTSAGTDTISGKSCSRRNGIAWATILPTVTSDTTTDKITYDLEGLNNQTFYILKSENPMKLYHNSTVVLGTTGITSLTFETISTNKVKVTVKAEKDISMGTQEPYHVEAELSEIVFIGNV